MICCANAWCPNHGNIGEKAAEAETPAPRSEYSRGWDAGLEQACRILDTDEALSGVSHTAIKIALRMLSRSTAPTPEPA